MPANAAKLVRRYYTYAGIYTLAASIIWGINTLFLLNAGLSIAEVFIANAAFSVGTVLFEIPTGVVADTIGRRASFLLSLVVLAASTLAYVGLAQIGAGVVAFSIASIFIGLGFTFYSGAMEAWLVDGIQALGYEGDMDGIFANAQIVGGVAMLVGTVGGGLLGQINLDMDAGVTIRCQQQMFGADPEFDRGERLRMLQRLIQRQDTAISQGDRMTFLPHRSGQDVHGRRTDKSGHEFRCRSCIDFQRSPDLFGDTGVHHHQAVRQCHGLHLIVGDIHRSGRQSLLQFLDLQPHLHPQFGIQVG